MSAVTYPPFFTITERNRSAWVVVVSIVFFLYSLLIVTTKIVIQCRFVTLKAFDYMLVIGTITLFAQTVLTVATCKTGLGQHLVDLTTAETALYNKLQTALIVLSIVTEGCTKISVCMLFNAINSFQSRLLVANRILFVLIAAWIVCGSILVGFQCPLDIDWSTYTTSKYCSRRLPIVAFNTGIDLITDVALSILPVILIWNVQTTHLRKFQIITLFGCRFLVPVVKIPVMVYLWRDGTSADPTWDAVLPGIWFQISLNLSMITACVPSLKPIFDSMFVYTAGAVIQAPYQLEANEGGGLGTTPLDPVDRVKRVELGPSPTKSLGESSRKHERTASSEDDGILW